MNVWTDGQTAVLALLVLLFILGFLGDAYSTMIGLQHGYIEQNRLSKWLFAKIGQSLTVFIEGTLVLFIGGTIAAHRLGAGYLYFGIVGGLEMVQALRNYLKLRKAKISLK